MVAKLRGLAEQTNDDLGMKEVGPGCRPLGKVEDPQPLIDHDGKPTRWGRFGPSQLNNGDMQYQRGLNSLSILAYLKVTEHITGDAKYTKAYHDLLNSRRAIRPTCRLRLYGHSPCRPRRARIRLRTSPSCALP